MNERIKELWGKAAAGTADNSWESQVDFIEKFAELIVQECVSVCESMPLLGPFKEVQDATLKDASVQILEHFGVKD